MLNTSNTNKAKVQSRAFTGKQVINIIIAIAIICGQWLTVNAQTDDIPYQGVARDASGNIVANQTISLRFSLLQGSATGTLIHQETHTTTTNTLGLFTTKCITSTTGTFNPSHWTVLAAFGAFIKVEMDITGGTSYVDMGTTQLMSVPFALYAKVAGSTPGSVNFIGTWNALTNTPVLASSVGIKGDYYVVLIGGATSLDGISDWGTGDWAIFNGSAWEKVDNSEAPVIADNVAFTPNAVITSTNVQEAIEEVSDSSVAYRALLNSKLTTLTTSLTSAISSKVDRAGDTMTGDLILNADPTTALGAATKQYVDAFQGAVTYADDWNASTNSPPLSSSIGTKGFYYVVTTAGSSPLSGITEWNVGDWAIYDGSSWGKVDNSEAPVVADNVDFTPTPQIPSTNVQDAIVTVQSDFYNLIDSYIHKTDDGVALYTAPVTSEKRFGIGVTTPDCRLGIKAEGANESLISFHDGSSASKWHINRNPDANTNTGFNIDQVTTAGNASRLFIQETTGFIGMGTTTPEQKLHVQGANDGGNVSIMIENTEAGINTGWLLSVIDDNSTQPRQRPFAIHEKSGSSLLERITVLPTSTTGIKNVGINEVLPYATLHVTKPSADPTEPVNLAENTGILCLGQIDDNNLAMDSRQIQARHGEYIGGGSTLSFTNSPLSLQPLGGGIKINGSMAPPQQATITSDGMLGLGTLTPVEKIDINGAIRIGDATNTNDGTIRYTGTDFEGRTGGAWVSMTNSAWFTPVLANTTFTNKMVGIGTTVPEAPLDVKVSGSTTLGRSNFVIRTDEANINATAPFNRIGMKVSNTGPWSANAFSKDIGIYVSDVIGQSSSASNLAAVLNGNVVVGSLTGSDMIGTSGSKVVAIQNGTAPTSAISGSGLAADGGIQLYSESDAMGVSTFHLMNGDGTIMKLFRAAALTPADNSTISSTAYGATEADVINNLRQRINDLEAKLVALGLIAN